MTPKTLNKARRELLKCDYLGPVVKEHGKCVIDVEKSDPFDTLISSIISQQLSVKAAATIESRVRKLAGKQFRPTKLLKISSEDLRGCGLSTRKTEYVLGIADAVKRRKLNFKKLVDASDEEVTQKLVELRGVGQWTAEMFMIFSLGRMDVFSVLDVGLQRGMRILFGDEACDLQAMTTLAERWQPYRSVASWYLWKVVD
ncbi:DNA-3-methyladenine glycosylase family protein [Aliikangiella coralliicola]|uniref:DNA-3-methyladenine glycosylase II n=1 Tax=Aliikangiella coralliicola TaxID=2592383 RepID=A0A545UIG2_9GAMM|nr:DNA-3-methyladenine glycosylase [Aliikangiella coralliicola]TQV89248.1 DNA-3-methyladenine glycosylase 2 family protein [Aliikangiella coralliicola]